MNWIVLWLVCRYTYTQHTNDAVFFDYVNVPSKKYLKIQKRRISHTSPQFIFNCIWPNTKNKILLFHYKATFLSTLFTRIRPEIERPSSSTHASISHVTDNSKEPSSPVTFSHSPTNLRTSRCDESSNESRRVASVVRGVRHPLLLLLCSTLLFPCLKPKTKTAVAKEGDTRGGGERKEAN